MTKLEFALVMTAFVSTGVMAQTVPGGVGVIQSIDGLVTVSQANTLGTAVKDARILDGARIVTTGAGTTVVKLDNGCLIKLDPNQSVTIDSKLDCRAQAASIQPTVPVAAAAGTGVGTGVVLGALGVGAIALIGNQSKNASGN